MKSLLRSLVINLFSLWLTPQIILGFKITGSGETFILAACTLTALNTFVRPILKLLLLPLNLVTFGLFSWIINVLILYGLTLVFSQIKIEAWNFSGLSYRGFSVPAFYFNVLIIYILTSFSLSLISNILEWLAR